MNLGSWRYVLLICILLAVIGGCTAPPSTIIDIPGVTPQTTPGPAATVQPITTPTAVFNPSVVSSATPYPTTTPVPIPDPTPYPVITQDEHIRYESVYTQTIQFHYEEIAVIVDVPHAPLIITTDINPVTITRRVIGTSQFGKKDEFSIAVNRVSEGSWYECTVRDAETGAVVTKNGYGRIYSLNPELELIIRMPGVYHVTFTGNMVKAFINMQLPVWSLK